MYEGILSEIVEILPSLMNNIRIMHTISRYYGTKDRMTVLYMKITNQMIKKCKETITDPGKLWDQDKLKLIENIKTAIDLNAAYQEQYRLTRDRLLA